MNSSKTANKPANGPQASALHAVSPPESPASSAARWQSLRELLLSPPTRVHRYRNLSTRLFENVVDVNDCGSRH
ncbi:MAG TPA: hypothetical protein VIS31_09935 [Woeseiaceae bacterium]